MTLSTISIRIQVTSLLLNSAFLKPLHWQWCIMNDFTIYSHITPAIYLVHTSPQPYTLFTHHPSHIPCSHITQAIYLVHTSPQPYTLFTHHPSHIPCSPITPAIYLVHTSPQPYTLFTHHPSHIPCLHITPAIYLAHSIESLKESDTFFLVKMLQICPFNVDRWFCMSSVK